MRRAVSAIREERAHVVLYGERGVGKTSLTYALGEWARRAGYAVVRKACSSTTTYQGLVHGIIDAAHSSRDDRTSALRPENPDEAVEALAAVSTGKLLVFIDEFDRVQEEGLRLLVAETIKSLSDRDTPVTLVIVGVAGSLSGLLGRHPSIQRNVVGIRLEPMSHGEIGQIIEVGAQAAGIGFEENVRKAIAELALGMPYYAHSLCLSSMRAALERGVNVVSEVDLLRAMRELIDAQDPEFGRQYDAFRSDFEREQSSGGASSLKRDPRSELQPGFSHYVLLRLAAMKQIGSNGATPP